MPKDLSGAQVGTAPGGAINNPRPNNMRGRNEFPQSFFHPTTERYGENSPFFWAKCERGDVQNLHSVHDISTFTLKSPMKCKVSLEKAFYKIPMQAIYPRNWEQMMTIPTQGDDVPALTRSLLDVTRLIRSCITSIQNVVDGTTFLKSLLLLELICSNGGLLAKFNMHLNARFSTTDGPGGENLSLDRFYEKYVWPKFIEYFKTNALIIDGIRYFIGSPNVSSGVKYVSARRFIELFRRNDWSIDDADFYSFLEDQIYLSACFNSSSADVLDPYKNFLNIEPVVSYQLACAQFCTNDHVDFIYSAQLYRDNMQSLYLESDSSFPTFTYNGIMKMYDVFSGHVFNDLIIATENYNPSAFDYFINLFSYVPSLRLGDYFTIAKPQPLAVGEYSAEVVDNSVSAVDITRSIQMQRLLNRVNMVGRKLGDYLAGIFGGGLPEAPKDVPIFLNREVFDIQGFATTNTGDAQFSEDYPNITTMNLHTQDSKFAFEVQIDEPCYIIGVHSYFAQRTYSRTMDKFAFHHDRYDDFIPEMQYIGDQDIQSQELDSVNGSNNPFGYCLRYMEYKKRYSYASGGFIEDLPSWAFITDNEDGNPFDGFINPDYIRSSPSEFDRFYKSLNGYSLGTYYHFIIAADNITAPIRMMEYTPEILK